MKEYEKTMDQPFSNFTKRDGSNITKNTILLMIASIICSIAILVCAICDIAMSGRFTWSLIPISTIVFSWLISIPAIIMRRKRILSSLISLSICIVPYLFILSSLVKVEAVFTMGSIMAIVSLIFLWLIFTTYHHLKDRKILATAITFLLVIPFAFVINVILTIMILEPIADIWDILSAIILITCTLTLFAWDYIANEEAFK